MFRPVASCGRMEFKGSSTYGQDPPPSLGRSSFATEHLRLLFSCYSLVKELKVPFLLRGTDRFTRYYDKLKYSDRLWVLEVDANKTKQLSLAAGQWYGCLFCDTSHLSWSLVVSKVLFFSNEMFTR